MSYIGARSTSILGLIVSTRSCLSKIVPEFVTLGSGSNQASGSNTAAKNQPNLFQGPNAIFSGKFDFSLFGGKKCGWDIYVPTAVYGLARQRGLLILDGHSSRWNPKLMRKFLDHGIDVVVRLSHTSHVTQPLDAVVFGKFKEELARSVRRALYDVKKMKNTPEALKSFEDELGTMDRALQDMEVDPDDDDNDLYSPCEAEVQVPEALNEENSGIELSLPERRAILVNTAKYALYCALWRGHVTNCFERTGMYPLSVERCLKRDGVRRISAEVQVIEDMANAKKRKRLSINGRVLTSQDAIEMLESDKSAIFGPALPKRPRGRPPKKKVLPYDTDDE